MSNFKMMKYRFFFFCLFTGISGVSLGQSGGSGKNVEITVTNEETTVQTRESGGLLINVSQKDLLQFKENGYIRYSDFGAKGDGKTDDIDAIAAAHAVANRKGLPVEADEGASYYIGGKARTAVIQTDTDLGTAEFIIDDTKVEDRRKNVFLISSTLLPVHLEGVSSFKKDKKKINVPLPGPCLITVTNSAVKRYIRYGPNQNDGTSQTDRKSTRLNSSH